MKSVTTMGAIFLILFNISCKENKEKVTETPEKAQPERKIEESSTASFSNDRVHELFQEYQQLRLALVATDAKQVQALATEIAKEHTENYEELKTIALAMSEEVDVEKQRVLFSTFTEKTEPLFKDFLTEGKLYKQFCPMAFEGKGGYWISAIEEIQNPYYGDKMLKCGKVVEVIQ